MGLFCQQKDGKGEIEERDREERDRKRRSKREIERRIFDASSHLYKKSCPPVSTTKNDTKGFKSSMTVGTTFPSKKIIIQKMEKSLVISY